MDGRYRCWSESIINHRITALLRTCVLFVSCHCLISFYYLYIKLGASFYPRVVWKVNRLHTAVIRISPSKAICQTRPSTQRVSTARSGSNMVASGKSCNILRQHCRLLPKMDWLVLEAWSGESCALLMGHFGHIYIYIYIQRYAILCPCWGRPCG